MKIRGKYILTGIVTVIAAVAVLVLVWCLAEGTGKQDQKDSPVGAEETEAGESTISKEPSGEETDAATSDGITVGPEDILDSDDPTASDNPADSDNPTASDNPTDSNNPASPEKLPDSDNPADSEVPADPQSPEEKEDSGGVELPIIPIE